ncbi:MAG: thiolase domain-containing protein [Anaerolineales bacterium]|nr:thiolase domain-containing protein [Anaerolineales bacterium]
MQAANDVLILGIGQTNVGELWELSLRELALHAISKAREEAGGIRPEAIYVANMLAPILSNQAQLGTYLADFAGLRGVEAAVVEAGNASGGAALRQGYLAVASGAVEVAMVVGVEKFSEHPSAEVEAALATSSDSDYEAVHGATPTAQAAMLMRRYLHTYGAPSDALAGFPVVAHANGAANPNAMFQRAISPENYQRSGMVADPINMFDAAPLADGAAAIILVRASALPESTLYPTVRIASSAAATDTLALHDRVDPLVFQAAAQSSRKAFAQAGITPEMVDFFELHDQFSIYCALSLEAAGFCKPGEGWKMASEGEITLSGRLPICTAGGCKARGEVGAATGVYQAVEAVLQLQQRSGKNQIEKARIGMIQSLSNVAGTAVTHILTRE